MHGQIQNTRRRPKKSVARDPRCRSEKLPRRCRPRGLRLAASSSGLAAREGERAALVRGLRLLELILLLVLGLDHVSFSSAMHVVTLNHKLGCGHVLT